MLRAMQQAFSGPVVGIVGGGQLARMMAEAAAPLGIRVRVLAGPSDEGASEVVPDILVSAPDDAAALAAFAATVDVLTFDHENVDHDVLRRLEADGMAVRPSVATLAYSDKAHQRRAFRAAGIPVPDFEVLTGGKESVARARAVTEQYGGRVVVKASRGGYDGRGVWMLDRDTIGEFVAGWSGAPLVLEPRLDLLLEVAALVARRPSGDVATWPLVETVQVDGMCDEVILPAAVAPELEQRAREIAAAVAAETGVIGVMAIELFVVRTAAGGTDLLVNEIAPRVHNSGHLTIEGTVTSQFEQHLRAVLDWHLGPTDPVDAAAVMVNVVGGQSGDPRQHQGAALAAVPEAHLHLYGKTARPARKVGHVTVVGADVATSRRRARLAADLLAGMLGSAP